MKPFHGNLRGGKAKLLALALALTVAAPWGAVAMDDDLLRVLKGDLSESETVEDRDNKTLYTVKKGDTLWSIARGHQMELGTLQDLNGLQGNTSIRPGMELVVEGTAVKQKNEDDQIIFTNTASYPEGSRGALISSFQWPLIGAITSPFGLRPDPYNPAKDVFHHGLDIAGDMGEPVRALADGVVTFAGTKPGYGKMVILQHEDGIKTVYAHFSKGSVKEGQKVKGGEKIGLCGSTGRSTGPHLHLELHFDDEVVNPLIYLKGRKDV